VKWRPDTRDRGCGSERLFGSVDHDRLLTLIGKQVADSRVLRLIQQMLKAGYEIRVAVTKLHEVDLP